MKSKHNPYQYLYQNHVCYALHLHCSPLVLPNLLKYSQLQYHPYNIEHYLQHQ